MNSKAKTLVDTSTLWLKNSVFPLWSREGIDATNGSFVESLSQEGKATASPRRAMVQARQIFSYAEALKMKIISQTEGEQILKNSTRFLIDRYQLPSGAFQHAVHPDGSPESRQSELYTQAFALFGLAKSYGVLKNPESKERAKMLLKYLKTERRAPHGGYTEIKNNQVMYQSNPHMHLFEAALAWKAVDADPEWSELCEEIFELCQNRFIDQKTGALCEHFDENWQPLLENGRFFFEPGHHYEWAWLLIQFEKLTGKSAGEHPQKLFSLAENHGLKARPLDTGLATQRTPQDPPPRFAIDEVWSHLEPKKTSSRFWPQTERIKAAVELGLRSPVGEQPKYAASADEAMLALSVYLDTPFAGGWQDTLSETNEFVAVPPKSSSLYHIILALSEYVLKRPLLAE